MGSDDAPFGLNGVFIRPLSLVWLLTVFWLKHENKTWEALTWVFLSRCQEREQSQGLYQVCVTLLRAFQQTCCWKNIYYNINKREEKSNACKHHCYQCRATTLLITILFTDFSLPKGKILSVRFLFRTDCWTLRHSVYPWATFIYSKHLVSLIKLKCVIEYEHVLSEMNKMCLLLWLLLAKLLHHHLGMVE